MYVSVYVEEALREGLIPTVLLTRNIEATGLYYLCPKTRPSFVCCMCLCVFVCGGGPAVCACKKTGVISEMANYFLVRVGSSALQHRLVDYQPCG